MVLEHLMHNLVHVLTAVFALGISIMAFLAYRRKHSTRFFIILIAFLLYTVKELLILLGSLWHMNLHIEHYLNFVVLMLFAYALLRK